MAKPVGQGLVSVDVNGQVPAGQVLEPVARDELAVAADRVAQRVDEPLDQATTRRTTVEATGVDTVPDRTRGGTPPCDRDLAEAVTDLERFLDGSWSPQSTRGWINRRLRVVLDRLAATEQDAELAWSVFDAVCAALRTAGHTRLVDDREYVLAAPLWQALRVDRTIPRPAAATGTADDPPEHVTDR